MKTKIPLAEAKAVAYAFSYALRQFCERIEPAGSVRRQKDTVGDIEIVAIPRMRYTYNLIGEDKINTLWTALEGMQTLGQIQYSKRGEKYRQFTYGGIQIDLFTAEPDSWGWIFLIWTGSAEFSTRIARLLNANGYTSVEGKIRPMADTDTIIPTPTEDDVFRLAGIPFVPPEKREN